MFTQQIGNFPLLFDFLRLGRILGFQNLDASKIPTY